MSGFRIIAIRFSKPLPYPQPPILRILTTRSMRRAFFISTGIMLVFGLVLVSVYWDMFSLMGENMAAMGEGRAIAEAIRSPDDLLDYLADHPESVSLVAYNLGGEAQGIFYGANVSRPVVGLTRLLVLAEYIRQVEEGSLDPESRVALDTLAMFHLPATDQGAHEHALQHSGYIGRDTSVAMAHLAETMIASNAGAAMDLLLDRLGRADIENLTARIGLSTLDAPLPSSGQFLSWSNHTLTSLPKERLAMLGAMSSTDYADAVYDFAATYRRDATFRAREIARLTKQGTDLALQQQRDLAQATLPRGSARAYADVLARALTDSLLSPGVSRQFIRILERPIPDSAGTILKAIGSEAGSFPGIISFVGYAHRNAESGTRIVALIMEDVPISVFYHLMQTGIDKGFEIQLLADDAFFDLVRTRLMGSARRIGLDDRPLVVAR